MRDRLFALTLAGAILLGLVVAGAVVYGSPLSFLVALRYPTRFAVLFIPAALVALVVVLARWIYLDAKERGLPAGMWALASVLAPGIGLVGYLVAREMKGPPAGVASGGKT